MYFSQLSMVAGGTKSATKINDLRAEKFKTSIKTEFRVEKPAGHVQLVQYFKINNVMKVIFLGYFTRDVFCSPCSLHRFEAALRKKKVCVLREKKKC